MIGCPPHTEVGALLAGMASGYMAGAFGMGGPPLVLWTMAHDWPAKKSRAFLWSNYLVFMPIQSCLLLWLFGWKAAMAMGMMLRADHSPRITSTANTMPAIGALKMEAMAPAAPHPTSTTR